MNYYILGPWGETGGPEALHQLCYELVNMKKSAKMIYYDTMNSRIQTEYSGKICGRYNEYDGVTSYTPDKISDIDKTDSVIVLPEICRSKHIEMFNNAKIVYWRLSNNTKEYALDPHNYDSLYNPSFQKCYTVCDCFWIYKKIKESELYDDDKVSMLRSNINLKYIQEENALKTERKNIVLFNPAKGGNHIDRLIQYSKQIDFDIEIEFVPLYGMNQNELKSLISISKLYLDFGHFPGADRLPRETASGGCVILIGSRGSGSDFDDFSIEEKIEWNRDTDTFDYGKICLNIIDIIKNYDFYFEKQKSYRDIIRMEQKQFIKQIKSMVNVLES